MKFMQPKKTKGRRVVGLVSGAHFLSHFSMLALPPLFPMLKDEFDVSYAALGAILGAFSIMTGIGQTPCGFLTDRFGGRSMVIAGLALMGVAIAAAAAAPSYWWIIILFGLAGIGNAVFHPADYAILAARIEPPYLGRAVSIHTFAGYIGWAAAPPVMLALATMWGWRTALVILGTACLGGALVLAWQAGTLWQETHAKTAEPLADSGRGSALKQGLSLMGSTPMVMLFLFFVLTATAGAGLQAFTAVAVMALFDASLVAGNAAITGYLLLSAVGVLVGGVIADRTARHNAVTAVALVFLIGCIAFVGLGAGTVLVAIAAMGVGGLFYGITSPSRDMMVRGATPAASVGLAFGFVATGLSIGNGLGPVLCGWIMDRGAPSWMFIILAAFNVMAIATVAGSKAKDPLPTGPAVS